MSPSGLGLGGNSFQYRVVPENWYADVKDYLENKLTIPVGSLTLLNTMCNSSSPWHSEGPGTFGRKCALNFMVAGDFERSYVQWATRGLNEDIENKLSILSNKLVENWGDRQISVLELDDRIATAAEKAPTDDSMIKLLRESLSDVKIGRAHV